MLSKKFQNACLIVDDHLFMTDVLLDDEQRESFKENFLDAWNTRFQWAEEKSKKEENNG